MAIQNSIKNNNGSQIRIPRGNKVSLLRVIKFLLLIGTAKYINIIMNKNVSFLAKTSISATG